MLKFFEILRQKKATAQRRCKSHVINPLLYNRVSSNRLFLVFFEMAGMGLLFIISSKCEYVMPKIESLDFIFIFSSPDLIHPARRTSPSN